jgi:uncharacterized cupredoxin-like copper-binding protein
MTMTRRRILLPLLGLALALGSVWAFVAASASGSAHAAAATRTLSASKTKLKFSVKTLRAPHGKVTLVMKNPKGGSLPHAIAVEGKGVDKDGNTVGPGKTSRVTVTLKKGTYEFYCPVDGHKAAGMKGKLIVS